MTKFCTQCGTQLAQQDQFCAQCGSPPQSRSAQSAQGGGQPQTAGPPPPYAPPLQRRDMVATATPTLKPQDAHLPSITRFRFPPLLVAVARTLCLAVGLEIFFMFCCFAHDIDNNLALNSWSPYDTPMQLQQHAFHMGGIGFGWGLVLGGVGSWVKAVRDRKRVQ